MNAITALPIAVLGAALLVSCGGGGGSSGSTAPDPQETEDPPRDPTPFEVTSDEASEKIDNVAMGLLEDVSKPSTESVDVFGNRSLMLDLRMVVEQGALDFELASDDASLELEITDSAVFLVSDAWDGNLLISTPADGKQNKPIPGENPMPTEGSATYKGMATGAISVGSNRMLLGGASEISVDFASRNLDIMVLMHAFNHDGRSSDDPVGITATDVAFNPDGSLNGRHRFAIDEDLTSGSADPLVGESAALGANSGLFGVRGQTSVFYGELDNALGNIVWGTLARDEEAENNSGPSPGEQPDPQEPTDPPPVVTPPVVPPPVVQPPPVQVEQTLAQAAETAINGLVTNLRSNCISGDCTFEENDFSTLKIDKGLLQSNRFDYTLYTEYTAVNGFVDDINGFTNSRRWWKKTNSMEGTAGVGEDAIRGRTQPTTIPTSGTASYQGAAMGASARHNSNQRRIYSGASNIDVDFANNSMNVEIQMHAVAITPGEHPVTKFQTAQVDLDDQLWITATNLSFDSTTGAITGEPTFTVDPRTKGNADRFHGLPGEIYAGSGLSGPDASEIAIMGRAAHQHRKDATPHRNQVSFITIAKKKP